MLMLSILLGSLGLVIGSVGAAVVIVLLLLFPKSFQDRELVRTAIVFAGVAAIALIFVGRAAPVPGTLGRDRSARRQKNPRSEEHTSELQSLMRISSAVFCLKKK